MLIEIRRAGFVNKGAELMLNATMQKLRKQYPAAHFAMEPTGDNGPAPFSMRSKAGFLQVAKLWRYGFQFGDLLRVIPKRIRERFGIVLEQEIDVVIDAAGFAYGDQFGIREARELAKASRRWKRFGIKTVMLPQAFGPYTSPEIRKAMKIAVMNIDLIFARESISYRHLIDTVGEHAHIKMAPDFTNLVTPIVPSDFDSDSNRFCVVPNYRMIDKTTADTSTAYLPFLIKCVQYLIDQDAKPFLLIHEGQKDEELAEMVARGVTGDLSVIKESDPLKIKGIIGECTGSIGSRFHGLVSALSQGVPALGTGWSHKYQMLFEDYGFLDGLVDVTASNKDIFAKIDLILDSSSRSKIQAEINRNALELKLESESMWRDVFSYLDS